VRRSSRRASAVDTTRLHDNLRPPGVRVLYGETVLSVLGGICGYKAGELLADGVDHEQIAVWAVVPSKADVGTSSLSVRRVHLENRR